MMSARLNNNHYKRFTFYHAVLVYRDLKTFFSWICDLLFVPECLIKRFQSLGFERVPHDDYTDRSSSLHFRKCRGISRAFNGNYKCRLFILTALRYRTFMN